MHTKESLLNDLRKTDIQPKGNLLIHSTIKSIGEVLGGAETVIDAFMDYMRDRMLIFPTHSWSDLVSYLISAREMRDWVITLLKDNPSLFENADAI